MRRAATSSALMASLALAGLLATCSDGSAPADGGPDGDAPDGGGWTEVFEDLDRAVLSVWGRSPTEVYFAGGGLRTPGAEGALALRFDGERWERLDTQAAGTATFWWVHGEPEPGGVVWFVGEQGAAFRWDGSELQRVETGTDATIFGVYVAAPDDVWAVGGTPNGQGDNDVLLRWTGGEAFEAVEPPERLGVTYYKVAGNGPDDIYACGTGGVILRYDGQAWQREEAAGVRSILFTVATAGEHVLAVGGFPAVVLERVQGAWRLVEDVEVGTSANGVSVLADGTALVVGSGGVKLRRVDGRWIDDSLFGTTRDLHGAWLDGAGNAFAVGGNFNSVAAASRIGVIDRFGTPVPSQPRP